MRVQSHMKKGKKEKKAGKMVDVKLANPLTVWICT